MQLRTVTTVFFFIFLAACSHKSDATEDSFPSNPSSSIINSFKIAEQDIPGVEKEALYGDSDAALKLFQYNEYIKRDKSESRYWLLMAAQNGDQAAMKKLGEMMKADNNNYRNYLRSNYWLKKAGS